MLSVCMFVWRWCFISNWFLMYLMAILLLQQIIFSYTFLSFFLRLIKWLPPLTLKCNKFIIIKIFSFSFVHHHHHLPSTQSSISSIYFFVWKLLHDHNKLVINNDDNRYWFHIQWLKIFYQLEVPHNNFLFVWNAIINAAVINFGGW